MDTNNIIARILILILCMGTAACSTSSKSAQSSVHENSNQIQKGKKDHGWFPDEGVKMEGDTLGVYATAVGTDSADATIQAVNRAALLMEKVISERMENIRSETAKELGSELGLAEPEFLFAFREASDVVSTLVEAGEKEVRKIPNGNGMQGLARAYLSKQQLIEQLDEQLISYQQEWDAIKDSKAFLKF